MTRQSRQLKSENYFGGWSYILVTSVEVLGLHKIFNTCDPQHQL
jgi:hypothetical protein